MGSMKFLPIFGINKRHIIVCALILLLTSYISATPPQIDPYGTFELTECVYIDRVDSLEVIDIDGDFITVSANLGQVVMTDLYTDIDNITHWFGYIDFNMADYCGDEIEETLIITAFDNQSDTSMQTYGPLTFLGKMAVSMDEIYIWPGDEGWMSVYLDVASCFCLGGYVITVTFDPVVLSITNARLGLAIAGREQYFVTQNAPYGSGTFKSVFIIDPDSSICEIESHRSILDINFLLSDEFEYPENHTIPILFHIEETYYESNTITDNSGHGLWYQNGCDFDALQLDAQSGNIHVMDEHNVLLGDVNLNGYAYEVGDLVLAHNAVLDILSYPLSDLQRQAGDIDQDGLPISITDLMGFCYIINGGTTPDYPRNPTLDTLMIESAMVSPGDQLSLPIFLITADTLVDFQAYLVSDTNYITLDSVVLNDELLLGQTYVSGFPHIFSFTEDECFSSIPELFYPGSFFLGNLIGRVKPDINQVVSTPIEFYNDDQYLAYTGLANLPFFEPVMISADVTILGASEFAYLPGDINMAGGVWPPAATGPDVTYLVNFFRGMESSQPCYLGELWASADVNADCNVIGSDVTRLVRFFSGQGAVSFCADYPPSWPTPADLPAEAPENWPNCEE